MKKITPKILMIIPADDNVDTQQLATQLIAQAKSITMQSFVPIAARASHHAMNFASAEKYLSQNRLNELLEKMVAYFYQDIQDVDSVVIPGLTYQLNKPYILELNRVIAKAFSAAVVIATSKPNSVTNIIAQDYGNVLGVMTASDIPTNHLEKISLENLDWLQTFLETKSSARLTPPLFSYELMKRAKKANKKIILPEGTDARTIRAANICAERSIATCILMGDSNEILKVVETENITLNETIEILNPDDVREKYVEPMVNLRKHKNLSPEVARKELLDNVVLGAMMLAQDEVDGLVSGAVHTTANTIRPALQLIKTSPEASLVSSIFFMYLPDQVLVFGDCAINLNPNANELADIAIQSADSACAFGIEPRVAMISYSTGTSGSGPDVEKVKEAVKIVQRKRVDIVIDGPLQYDAAIVPSVAKSKAPDSLVAGRATVFVFPDLNTGNTVYKAVQRSANIVSVGPMLQGLNKPVNDLSRGCLVEDIVFTIALTAVQSIRETR